MELPMMRWLIVILIVLIAGAIYIDSAQASWPSLTGRASVFGDDPFQGVHDSGDNGITALGKPSSDGGIAVMNRRTLGGYWTVCAPRQILSRGVKRCHTLKQSEIGPAFWTGRVVDITAVTARRAWKLRTRTFPTDKYRWRLRYRGHRRPLYS